MSDPKDHELDLLESVDLLTKDRRVKTGQWIVKDGEEDETLELHTEIHPPLLVLLLEGTGVTRGAPSSNIRIPIDVDALEIWGQIRDLIKLWCKQLDASFIGDDLVTSVRHWYLAHANAVRANKLRHDTDRDISRMVASWVRMIENKFDPPEKREWTDPCPAYLETRNLDGEIIGTHRCGARRLVENGEERFAIQINVTTLTAECARCHCKWVGKNGLMMLRYESNLWNLQKAEDEKARLAELERLAAGQSDTQEAEYSA